MDDRTLLEMAAKAAGIVIKPGDHNWNLRGEAVVFIDGICCGWNPLTDDGDALRLAVKLHLALLFPMHGDSFPQVGAGQVGSLRAAKMEPAKPDPYAATRRAIVRAAAAIGAALP